MKILRMSIVLLFAAPTKDIMEQLNPMSDGAYYTNEAILHKDCTEE